MKKYAATSSKPIFLFGIFKSVDYHKVKSPQTSIFKSHLFKSRFYFIKVIY